MAHITGPGAGGLPALAARAQTRRTDMPADSVRWAEAWASALSGIPVNESLMPRELTPEQIARRDAERAAYEAQRCPACGCHPDEHGEY